jgi:hypothetical protein
MKNFLSSKCENKSFLLSFPTVSFSCLKICDFSWYRVGFVREWCQRGIDNETFPLFVLYVIFSANPKDDLSYKISWITRIFNSGMFACLVRWLCVHGKHKNQKSCKRMKFPPTPHLISIFLAQFSPKKILCDFFYINNRIHEPPVLLPLLRHAIIIDLILAAMFVYYCVIEYAAEISSHA